MLMLWRSWPTSPAACHVVPLVSCLRSRRTMSLQPIRVRWYATEQPMTPPPTMTTLARVGRSSATLTPHPQIVGIEGRAREHRRRAPLALNEQIEHGAWRCELRRDAGECQTFLDPVAVGPGCDHADAAILDHHGLA